VTTPNDTIMSCLYFAKNASKLPSGAVKIAAANLVSACKDHGLTPPKEIEKLAEGQAAKTNLYIEGSVFEKAASAVEITERPVDCAYALNGRYPIANESQVKQAAAYLVNHFHGFESEDRHIFAKNVLTKAAELDVNLTPTEQRTLTKVAGVEYGDRLSHQLNLRKDFASNKADALETLEKIAGARSTLNPNDFAALLNSWDKTYGTLAKTASSGRPILDSYQSTFDNILTKESGYVWEDEQSGNRLSSKDIEKVATDKFEKVKGYFGETLANSLKKHGHSIFDSLPLDAKVVIARISKGAL